MFQLFQRKPWLFVVLGLVLFVLCDCVCLWICFGHPPLPPSVP